MDANRFNLQNGIWTEENPHIKLNLLYWSTNPSERQSTILPLGQKLPLH